MKLSQEISQKIKLSKKISQKIKFFQDNFIFHNKNENPEL